MKLILLVVAVLLVLFCVFTLIAACVAASESDVTIEEIMESDSYYEFLKKRRENDD